MSIFTKQLAIDIGSNNLRVFSPKQGVVFDEPAIVAYSKSTKKIAAIGLTAGEMLGRENKSLRVVSPVKRGVIANVDSTEAILKYALKQAGRPFYLGRPDAMISISGSATSAETRALIDVAKSCGIGNVNLIETSTAAALGATLPIVEPRGYMVVDIGGGTTEVGVFSLGGVVYNDSLRFGGNDIDKYLVQRLRTDYSLVVGQKTAEELKIKYGKLGGSNSKKTINVNGNDKNRSAAKAIKITPDELSLYLERSLNKITNAIKQAFANLPPDLVADIASSGIALTGGGANLTGLANYLSHRVNVQCYVVGTPAHAVIRGAHISLVHLDQYQASALTKSI